MSAARVTRVRLEQDFALAGDGGVHDLGQEVTITVRAQIVGVEQEMVEVTRFESPDKEFLSTGVRTVKLLPLSAKVQQ